MLGFQQSSAPRGVAASSDLPSKEGYWIEPGDEIPSTPPGYEPTGAILLAPTAGPDGFFDALDLINNGGWCPLSHAAVLTYLHSSGLADGETWHFVVFDNGTRTVFRCEPPLRGLDIAEVARLFGDVAAQLARPDWPAVLLRVRSTDAPRANGR